MIKPRKSNVLRDFCKNRAAKYAPIIGLIGCLCAACGKTPPTEIDHPTSSGTEDADTGCGADGLLTVDLTGAIRLSLDWDAGNLSCEGMRRPEDQGARLRFTGKTTDEGESHTLTFILGLPDLKPGMTGAEMPTNVTLTKEGTGRFFSTADTSSCWTDITHHAPVAPSMENEFSVGGNVYCISPIPELNGNSNVTFTEMRFFGQLTWEQTE